MSSVICLEDMHLCEGLCASYGVPMKASTDGKRKKFAIAIAQSQRAKCVWSLNDAYLPRQDKVKLTPSCLGGHLQIHGDIEPSPIVLGEQASMEIPHNASVSFVPEQKAQNFDM